MEEGIERLNWQGAGSNGATAENAQEYAANYNPDKYQHPSVTVDLVILTVQDRDLRVLLVRRSQWPFAGSWALPGGFVQMDEPLYDTARRELQEETGLEDADLYLEQLYTFGDPGRDPRTRVITVAYFALVPSDVQRRVRAGGDAADVHWHSVYSLPELAFDHDKIIESALRRLRSKLDWTPVAFRLLPEQFTLGQLQGVYEIILHQPLDKRNFRKKILNAGVVKPVPNARLTGAHRPASLYRFVEEGRYEWGATGGDQP